MSNHETKMHRLIDTLQRLGMINDWTFRQRAIDRVKLYYGS